MCKSCIPPFCSYTAQAAKGNSLVVRGWSRIRGQAVMYQTSSLWRARQNHSKGTNDGFSEEKKKNFPSSTVGLILLSSPLRKAKRKEAIYSHEMKKEEEKKYV